MLCPRYIDSKRRSNRSNHSCIEELPEGRADDQELDARGEKREYQDPEEDLCTASATLQDAREPAGLPLQMEGDVQVKDVCESVARYSPGYRLNSMLQNKMPCLPVIDCNTQWISALITGRDLMLQKWYLLGLCS